MSTALAQWELAGAYPGHEVRIAPTARRASCSCGHWAAYDAAPRDIAEAVDRHIAEERDKAVAASPWWRRNDVRADWAGNHLTLEQSKPIRPLSLGERLIEQFGGPAQARMATHPDTRDPASGLTDVDFRAVQEAISASRGALRPSSCVAARSTDTAWAPTR